MIPTLTVIFCINFIALAVAMSCGRPQVPKYMRIQPDQQMYDNGAPVAYYCRLDKVLVSGRRVATCDNGQWRERLPICASYSHKIKLDSMMRLQSASNKHITDIRPINSSCNESHACFSWTMSGKESFIFSLSEQQTMYKFIRMNLMVKVENNYSLNKGLLKSIIDVNTGQSCDIYDEDDNEYDVLCLFKSHTKSVPILSIEPSVPQTTITLCKFDIGYMEEKCGEVEKPIGTRDVIYNGEAATIRCLNGNFIDFKCMNGVWISNNGSPRCELTTPVADHTRSMPWYYAGAGRGGCGRVGQFAEMSFNDSRNDQLRGSALIVLCIILIAHNLIDR